MSVVYEKKDLSSPTPAEEKKREVQKKHPADKILAQAI